MEWLRNIRKKKGLSQAQVATMCGISRQYYNFIENGMRGCNVKTARKIALALGFPWQRFFDENAGGGDQS